MTPQTHSEAEPTAAARWAAVKPITQGELIDAVRAALKSVPTADAPTGAAENYAVVLRLAAFICYIGHGRPRLARELRRLQQFAEGESTGAAS